MCIVNALDALWVCEGAPLQGTIALLRSTVVRGV